MCLKFKDIYHKLDFCNFLCLCLFQIFDDLVVSGAADKTVLVHNVRVSHTIFGVLVLKHPTRSISVF